MVIILDFGSQYTQLIARRLRDLDVYCEIQPYNKPFSLDTAKALILSGSPASVHDTASLQIDISNVIGKIPILSICYGAQYIAHVSGGKVERSQVREYGRASMQYHSNDPLFKDIPDAHQIWMSHGDSITSLPEDFALLATSSDIIAAYKVGNLPVENPTYGIQFHPEVTHSPFGKDVLRNFIEIAGITRNWDASNIIHQSIDMIRALVGNDHVLMGLSGGVDSTVAAMLIKEAIGERLQCIFVDNGLLRKNEFNQVLHSYEDMGLNIKGVKAQDLFLSRLKGISDPEAKRKSIGKTFIDVFEAEAKSLPKVKWLGQGTIYPDVIESVSVHGPSVTIKSHHNVGGLPEKLHLKLVEPLRLLFKDEVRRVGKSLQISDDLLQRHPYPGPGLGIRILGEVTEDKVKLCQEADAIFIDKLKSSGWYQKVWQSGAILLPVQSVGVMGDERTYESTIALRCVNSIDGMTAEWSALPHELLAEISSEIINKVKGINRVVYDISTKPPATIEWE
ncbi:MAG: glutamine-hydrolyzing GMP synthase [Saprospiraceae bacterium]